MLDHSSQSDVDRSLELTGDEMRRLVDAAMQRLAPFLDSLDDQPASDDRADDDIARRSIEPLPEEGRPAHEVLDLLFRECIPPGLNPASPGYLAYIPGGGLPESAVADLIADVVNRYVGVWIGAPALVEIEANVIRWFCDLVGYPAQSAGFLTSGGSLANWSALVTARRCRLPENFLSGVIYTSTQSHHSVQKAAMLAGFPQRNVRQIATDDRFRIRTEALIEAVARDRNEGLAPFAIVGNAGTTNTGAVDDLTELAAIARSESLWFHVDAAYGGFVLLTERGRRRLAGIGEADSITLDPHKGLFLPYGTGCLLARDREHLRAAHDLRGDYMPAMQQESGRVDFSQISPELTREFRGLRVWLPLKLHGAMPFRENLDEKLDLAILAADGLRAIPDVEVVAEPQLSVLAFRYHPPGQSEDELSRLNRKLLDRINARRNVLLTPTTLGGRFVIRIAILSFRTHAEHIETCLSDIRAAITT